MRNIVCGLCVVLAFAAMFSSNVAHAMEIYKFDEMAVQDQDAYIAMLVQGAEKVLKDDGRLDDAANVSKLFITNGDNGISVGMNKFMIYLALVRKNDADRVGKDPHATRLEVEHVMYITFAEYSISLLPILPGVPCTLALGAVLQIRSW
jgi:hypothetical protein